MRNLLLGLAVLLSTRYAIAKNDTEAFKKITKAPPHVVTEEVAMDAGEEANHDEEKHLPAVHSPKITTEPAPGIATKAPASTAAPATAAAVKPSPQGISKVVTADQSLKWLMNGNTRYVSKNFRSDGRSADDRKRLVAGQHPHAIVLSCADSRTPPEIIFDQMLGEIYTIRVAGEALDSSVIASIESAVEHLHPTLLVVMGHTQCDAVDAALKTKDGESAGSEALDKLVADIRPRLKSISADKISSNLEVESTVNADGVARDLLKRSEIVRKKVEAGELVIKPALYRMDTGKVSFLLNWFKLHLARAVSTTARISEITCDFAFFPTRQEENWI